MMRILVFQHVACEHPGIFRDYMREDGFGIHTVELDEGESIPPVDEFDALLVMGGPMDVWEKSIHPWLEPETAAIHDWVAVRKRPFLGFCLGHQLLAEALGGVVGPAATPEIGIMTVGLTDAGSESSFLAGVPRPLPCFQWHSAEILRVPDGARVLASSPACAVNAMSWGGNALSVQFHVEITAETVAEWGRIPAYSRALEDALGEGALARLDAEVQENLGRLHACARQIYENFVAMARLR